MSSYSSVLVNPYSGTLFFKNLYLQLPYFMDYKIYIFLIKSLEKYNIHVVLFC